jgi:hypothetical protein
LYTNKDFEIFFGNTDVAEDIRDSEKFRLEYLIDQLKECATDLGKAGLNEFMALILEILVAIFKAQNNIGGQIEIYGMLGRDALEVCVFFGVFF